MKRTLFFALLLLFEVSLTVAECGHRKVKAKFTILHGFATYDGQWPWHAAIYHKVKQNYLYQCGGVLIDDTHVLSAGHCVMEETLQFQLNPALMKVHLGRQSLGKYTPYVQEHSVERAEVHQNFNRLSRSGDIALIVLQSRVQFTDYVQPVCLPKFKVDALFNQRGIMIGFGLTEHQELSDFLKGAIMPILSPLKCLQTNRDLFGKTLEDGIFCAGQLNGTGACSGDSGGGLYVHTGDTWYVVGITSFTGKSTEQDLSCSKNDLTAFTDVPFYLDWIHQYTNGSSEEIVTYGTPSLPTVYRTRRVADLSN
jgi:secreted trypsin-like serine protease